MTLSYSLVGGAVLTVSRPRGEYLGEATEVSFYASRGTLDPALRDALDAAIPVTFGGPDSELAALVLAVLGDRHDPSLPTCTRAPQRGETAMEALDREIRHDRESNYNH